MFETTRRHLYLAGFMGTGKSAIGRAIATRLGWGFIDLDELVVGLCRRSIPEIFVSDGEPAFRNYEARALRLAVISPHSVIALGGGTPIRADNANIIRTTGRCWLLTARLDVIWQRVSHEASQRPLLSGMPRSTASAAPSFEDFRAVADPLLQQRHPAYSHLTDRIIDTSHGSIDSHAMKIINELNVIAGTGAGQ